MPAASARVLGVFCLGLQGTYWAPGDVLRFRVVETACEELCTVKPVPRAIAARRGVAHGRSSWEAPRCPRRLLSERGWLGSVREAERCLPGGEWCWPSPGGAQPICLPGLEWVGVDGATEGGPRELPAAGLRTWDFIVEAEPLECS